MIHNNDWCGGQEFPIYRGTQNLMRRGKPVAAKCLGTQVLGLSKPRREHYLECPWENLVILPDENVSPHGRRIFGTECESVLSNGLLTGCSPSSDLTGLYKSPKLRDGLHLWSKCQVKLDSALTDFNSSHFKAWRKWPLKLISACFLMLCCLACNTVSKNWHICVNKGLT